jgi:NADPH:quinone reductase-like Zn-dependent oxidoreductase
VGAVLFKALFESLAEGGRMVVYSTAAGREAPLDLFSFYRRRLAMFGLNTGVLDATRCAEILRGLVPLFESGAVRPLEIAARFPLSEAPRAYAAMEQGIAGKVVLVHDR